MRPAPFERYFSGLQKMTCQNFAMTSSRGSKLRSKVTKISKFRFDLKCPQIPPKSPKMKKSPFFSQYFIVIFPFFQKNPILQVKTVISKIWPLTPYFFTFWAITSVLVGIFQICLHIWKLEKKWNRLVCDNKFFLSCRESGQNWERRSKSPVSRLTGVTKLKLGPLWAH